MYLHIYLFKYINYLMLIFSIVHSSFKLKCQRVIFLAYTSTQVKWFFRLLQPQKAVREHATSAYYKTRIEIFVLIWLQLPHQNNRKYKQETYNDHHHVVSTEICNLL